VAEAAPGPAGALTVRLFAGARAAAGTPQAQVAVPDGATVDDVLEALLAQHPGVARVLPACSFLLDGVSARPAQAVGPARTLDVLPPFSGG
jgi:molybdopterin converting factor small subunit